MTQEYAALVVGVDIALLVVGTVQILSLLKAAVADFKKLVAREDAALTVISDRLQAGDEPTRDELQAAVDQSRPRQVLPPIGLSFLGLLWALVSAALLLAIVVTVFWAADENPGPARLLATYTAWITAISATLLVLEALVQSARLMNALEEEEGTERAGMSPALYNAAVAKVEEYRHTQRQAVPVQADPDPQTTTDTPGQEVR
ncbi:hypothetical protein [Streptomyces sp. NPDC053367]|uniref:hypothetical protein n=1 Tax=Streptomyces sp. NPDC053367 TaxID=3365700 RepID=UPI0037D2CD0E